MSKGGRTNGSGGNPLYSPAGALSFIDRYFGAIPRPQRKLTQTYTAEPPQDGEAFLVGPERPRPVSRRQPQLGDAGPLVESVVVGVLRHRSPLSWSAPARPLPGDRRRRTVTARAEYPGRRNRHEYVGPVPETAVAIATKPSSFCNSASLTGLR